MANGEKRYMHAKRGNVRAPSKVTCLQWVRKAWEFVTEKVVRKSFKTCGISVRTNGSEDSEMHCLRSGVLPEEAADKLVQQTAALVAEDEHVDTFADLEDDEEEPETNEVVVEE